MNLEITEKPSLNVLFADDDKDDRFFFEKTLKELPISTNIIAVHDGEELMNYLNKHSDDLPDVLFLDLNMPRQNGFECLVEIKHNDKLKDLHIVMFSTSYPRDMNYERDMINVLFSAGAEDYIRKSDDFEDHKEVFLEILKKVSEKTNKKV